MVEEIVAGAVVIVSVVIQNQWSLKLFKKDINVSLNGLDRKIIDVKDSVVRVEKLTEKVGRKKDAADRLQQIGENAVRKIADLEMTGGEIIANIVIDGLSKLAVFINELLDPGLKNIRPTMLRERVKFFLQAGNEYAAEKVSKRFVERYFGPAHESNAEILLNNLLSLIDPKNPRNHFNNIDNQAVDFICMFAQNNCSDLTTLYIHYARRSPEPFRCKKIKIGNPPSGKK